MIKLKNISKICNSTTVLDNITLEIKKSEFFVIVGASGSGKTTLIKTINRLLVQSEGEICIDDKDISTYNLRELRLNIGYVLQKDTLFPNLTVCQNIALIAEMKKWKKSKILEEVKRLLELVGLDPKTYLNKYPHQISGGQRQRVGILRAIITSPKILLMDEPFSALDPISRNNLQDLIKKIHDEFKITTIFVTHDMNEALKLGDRICVMEAGKIVQVGTREEIQNNPKNDYVKTLFTVGDKNE
ncbi:ATP-binding cassette domain-containing protein [Oceanivirga miroungae]|uniref:Iron(III) ABC transporter, ATP-binding protein n=1 Tax=Oceanivirga miroungae TaxID=1130046 RepID=A0A6I8M7S8_9FUSO|nr:ABC transporter ATP-binding protein [Oceanivirga miroungae]VWL84880.1 iron(III) ABC transporter, ATP-binding protein [Oceanivirga miroungae]